MKRLVLALVLILSISFALNAQEKMQSKISGFGFSQSPVTSVLNFIPYGGMKYVYTVYGVYSVFPNIAIFPGSVNQTEISSAINPANPNIIIVGANTDNGQGFYFTTNGGLNWAGTNVLPGSVAVSTNPALIFTGIGTAHYNYYDYNMVSDRTTNLGTNWLGRYTISTNNNFDKNHNAVDLDTASVYFGRIYVGYTKWSGNYPIVISYSTNNGVSYSSEIQIGSPLSGHYEQGVNLQTGPGGDVYAVWATPQISNNVEDKIGFSKSLNGGVNWSAVSYPHTISGIRGTLLSSNIRVNSFPSMAVDRSGGARNGYIYLTWAQRNLSPAGSDADIIFSYSSNGGTSFSTPVRVNNDALNNGKQQFHPRMAIDKTNGIISIVFYDTRDIAGQDSCNTYLAMSQDGGLNWINFKISSAAQKPVPLQGYAAGYYGDNLGISTHNNIVYPFWMDNRSGPAQVYMAKVTAGPVITHTKLKDTENTSGPYAINATIIPFGSNLQSGQTKIFWGNTSPTNEIVMTNSSGNNWSGSITGSGTPAEYRYYIRTIDELGRESKLPANAPAEFFSFRAGPDTSKPVIIHTQIPDTPKTYFPFTLTATVTDNYGIDSVWVRWYRNNPPVGGINHFKLTGNGDEYTGIFNNVFVNYGNTIFYKIYAMDNSSSHNVDSSQLFQTYLKPFAFAIVGSGNIQASYPFFSFYTDSRTDMLYKASEITEAFGFPGFLVKVGFDFVSASPITLNNLNVKIKSVTDTVVTGFTSTGWTTAYSGNYTVPGTGIQMINLTTPYSWNGTDNLLVEICFDNSTYGQNSSVLATNYPNKVWHQHQDLTTGSGCIDLTGGSLQAARPNMVFVFSTDISVKNISTEIPSSFSLGQNYPNPFNPVTNIQFQVPPCHSCGGRGYPLGHPLVVIKVFDLLGKEVKTLVNEYKQPGTYQVSFNAEGLSSGVYFYSLIVDDLFISTKKFVLLK